MTPTSPLTLRWSPRRWDLFACLCLALITLPWWIAATLPFIDLDDGIYIFNNPEMHQGLSQHTIHWAFTTTLGSLWQPVTWLSLLLDRTLFGEGPGGFHAVNIGIHIVNAMLLYLLLARMTGQQPQSLFAAALFAMHPLRVESVAWVAERKDVLSAFFGLLAILAYWRFTVAGGRRRAAAAYVALCVCFACSLMSKLMLVTLPALLLLLDLWPLARIDGRNWRRRVLEKLPLLAISIVAALAVSHALAATGVVLRSLSAGYKIRNALVSYVLYLRDHFYFQDLAIYYPTGLPIDMPTAIGAAALLLFISALLVVLWKKKPATAPLLVGWCWFFGVLFPTMGLLQAGSQSRADRFTYFASIGLCIAVVWAWPRSFWPRDSQQTAVIEGSIPTRSAAPRPRAWAAFTSAGCVIVLTVYTTLRILLWRDPLALYLDGIEHTGGINPFLDLTAGNALLAAGNLSEAMKHYQHALRSAPQSHEAHYQLGRIYAALGQRQAATEEFRQALIHAPDNPTYQQAYAHSQLPNGK